MALPPTSTKGSADSTPVTTFQINAPNIPITHNGVVATIGTIPIAGGGTGQVTAAAAITALGGAKTDLSNLASTAVNADIIPNTTNATLLGSISKYFSRLYVNILQRSPTEPYIELAAAGTGGLRSGNGNMSLDWENRILKNSSGTSLIDYSGTVIDSKTHLISNVVDPVSAQDAATKNYVDGLMASIPTTQILTSGTGATYTTPAGVTYLKVTVVGGGGGSAGSGAGGYGVGGTGGTSIFGTSLLSATGGAGSLDYNGAAGGIGSVTSPARQIAVGVGGGGGAGVLNGTSPTTYASGGAAGNSILGGGGISSTGGFSAGAGAANTGGGAGGVGMGLQTNGVGSGGGGGGGSIVAIIPSPSATYTYTIGAGGTAGTAGTTGFAGSAGGSGVIIVEEYYGGGTASGGGITLAQVGARVDYDV